MTNAEEKQSCERRSDESELEWLVRMLEFHRNSHKWYIDNPTILFEKEAVKFVGDIDFHRMVYDRYTEMIRIAGSYL